MSGWSWEPSSVAIPSESPETGSPEVRCSVLEYLIGVQSNTRSGRITSVERGPEAGPPVARIGGPTFRVGVPQAPESPTETPSIPFSDLQSFSACNSQKSPIQRLERIQSYGLTRYYHPFSTPNTVFFNGSNLGST